MFQLREDMFHSDAYFGQFAVKFLRFFFVGFVCLVGNVAAPLQGAAVSPAGRMVAGQ